MIRSLINFILIVALGAGCGYYFWQGVQLKKQNYELKTEVAALQAKVKKLSHKHGHSSKSSDEEASSSEKADSAEGWLALSSSHYDKAQAAYGKHDYITALTEAAKAKDDLDHATAEPVQAADSAMAQARKRIAQIESLIPGTAQGKQ